jgi:hypothetical protein
MIDKTDMCDAAFGEREEHYKKSYGAYDKNCSWNERVAAADLAHKAAVAEMLTEIHAMLWQLTYNLKSDNDD